MSDISEIEIYSVNNWISLVLELKKRNTKNGIDEEVFFRGQNNYNDYGLTPALFRNNIDLSKEYIMFNDLISSSPEEFDDHRSIFSQLTKMQHYGLPTRLLDITSNPLIALYFACKGEYEKDGEIFILKNLAITYPNSLEVISLANLARFNSNQGNTIKDFRQLDDRLKKQKSKVLKKILSSEVIVKPQLRNNRIKQQSGAFILFGTKFDELDILTGSVDDRVEFELDNIEIRREIFDIKDKMINSVEERYKIPAQYKKNILKELEILGVNEAFLFPELEYQSNYIKMKYSNNISEDNIEVADTIIQYKTTSKNNYIKESEIDTSIREEIKLKLKYYFEEVESIDSDYYESFIEEFIISYDEIEMTDAFKRKKTLAKIKIRVKRLLKKHQLYNNVNASDIYNYLIQVSKEILEN